MESLRAQNRGLPESGLKMGRMFTGEGLFEKVPSLPLPQKLSHYVMLLKPLIVKARRSLSTVTPLVKA
jgi:hypothetical protein